MKKVINILVSLVFLISFIGVHIHKHYSQGKLYSVAVFADAEPCCEAMENCNMADMSHHQCSDQTDDDCSCENENEILQLNTIFVVSETQKLAEMPVFNIHANCCSVINIRNEFSNLNTQTINISPPLVETNFQTEFGVFLC